MGRERFEAPPLRRWANQHGKYRLVEGFGLRVEDVGLRAEVVGFRVMGVGLRVEDTWLWV